MRGQHKSRRARLLSQVHIGKARAGLSDEAYRGMLADRFDGKRSAADLTDTELETLAKAFRLSGLLDGRARGASGGASGTRPTEEQWDKLAALAREMWGRGLEAPGLATMARRVAKVSAVRFLTRDQASQLIGAMERWMETLRAKAAKQ